VNRISWEEYALRIAQTASIRSEDRFVKVGAAALDHYNRVIGVAYNGLASGISAPEAFWLDREKRRPYVIHAEINLLSLIKKDQCNILACTLLPCSSCASAIIAHGVKKVIYKEEYTRDNRALELFEFNNIVCQQISL
jgi:dCMP deaminase